MNPTFLNFEWKNGLQYQHTDTDFPTRLYTFTGEFTFDFKPGNAYYIYQYRGTSWINAELPIKPGHFATCSSNDGFLFSGSDSVVMVIERVNAEVPYMLMGGPIESKGRLKYIDGCSDSLLIAPWKLGEACLNHLHFPKGIYQTMHTHPTIRIGLVVKGHGNCVTPWGDIPLLPGQLFVILPEDGGKEEGHLIGSHCFQTTDSEMDVIAFHPDSDYGPTDENHPMINRTIVDSMPANLIAAIQTKEIN